MGLALVNLCCPNISTCSRWGRTGGLYHHCILKEADRPARYVQVHWEKDMEFLKKTFDPPRPSPKVSVAYASPSIHTLVSLQNEHIVLCRGGQFAEFHFTPSICLMNNNELEGFTGFQHWAEICINRFSDLTWSWFCMDLLPLACPCLAKFYAAKPNQPLHFPLKGRNQ